ncbi:MAG: DUF3306 domain-containing protein [Pseudomonadota bacterium]
MAEETTGFLGRWARRKTEVLQGKTLQEPVQNPVPVPVTKPAPAPAPAASVAPVSAAGQPDARAEAPVLSLEDVRLLTKDSDFKPFMAQNVSSEVRNAAMKKLFADPHFNVMDGLDIYVDDYSKSDPIPEAMLRQMTSSKFLKLFDEEEQEQEHEKNAAAPRESVNNPTAQTVAQSYEQADIGAIDPVPPEIQSQPVSLFDPEASQQDHALTHLRLQPDHAAPAPDAGRAA